jgi:GTP-binding protein HflX
LTKTPQHNVSNAERALLVGVGWKRAPRFPGMPAGEQGRVSLAELVELAKSAGAEIVGTVFQVRDSADSATLVGRGKLDEIRSEANAYQAPLIIFDSNLSPVQQRNIEELTERRVIDRTQLILDIFARHARSREGQLQVELAQLNYMLPRLTGKGTTMSRLGGKSGGGGAGGAGGAGRIGVRGPGEKKLETDRRRIRDRVGKIQAGIVDLRKQRALRREARNAVPLGTIALVGYTNAGKSTLFNRLTGAQVVADARMFATLDPTVRHVTLPSRRKVLLSDTVGFIRNLPATLVKAFRATLEEVVEASLLLHVVDISAQHAPNHTAQVLKVLSEIGAGHTRQILVMNKTDLLPRGLPPHEDALQLAQRVLGESHAPGDTTPACVSARSGEGLDALVSLIDRLLTLDPVSRATFRLPAAEGSLLHLLHERARVLTTRYSGDVCEVEAEVPESVRKELEPYLVA